MADPNPGAITDVADAAAALQVGSVLAVLTLLYAARQPRFDRICLSWAGGFLGAGVSYLAGLTMPVSLIPTAVGLATPYLYDAYQARAVAPIQAPQGGSSASDTMMVKKKQ